MSGEHNRHCGLDPQSPAESVGMRLGGRDDGAFHVTVNNIII